MDRFTAYLLLKKLVRDPETRHRARVAEHAMAQLATELEQDANSWAMMGLLLFLDRPDLQHNTRVARGVVARQQAEVDGLPAELGAALERCWQPVDEPTLLEDALRLVDWLVEHSGEGQAPELARQLHRQRQSGSPDGDRIDEALDRLALANERAVQIARDAVSLAEARP